MIKKLEGCWFHIIGCFICLLIFIGSHWYRTTYPYIPQEIVVEAATDKVIK